MQIPDWIVREADAQKIAGLEEAGYPSLFSRLLAARGVDAGSADLYLHPDKGAFAPPGELPGAEEAAAKLFEAAQSGGRIVVFGDYDCDGISATAIMVKALSAVGADVSPFIPDRLDEGYGMNAKSMARMLREHPGVKLVVTVDNGINSVAETGELKSRGVEVVVTDHHLPGDELPRCTVVNPKVASPSALEWLCGSGVAFFVANALVRLAIAKGRYSGAKISGPMIVLAGLATVTDIMPLTGQNRIFVAKALSGFARHAPPGLHELYERASRSAQQALTARDFGFLIGPRMNADGRMASGMDALGLILCDDREQAREYARRVDLRNVERKNVEQAMTDAAMQKIVPGAPAQVVDIPEGHVGVAGIVASRLLERLAEDGAAVPVCVAVGTHGSARAPEGYNVRDALAESSMHLTRSGGHAAAGGFTVKAGEMDLFRKAFCAACARQAADAGAVRPGKQVFDAWVEGRDLTVAFAQSVAAMEPFGEGNPEPVFAIHSAVLSAVRAFGQDSRHLLFEFADKSIPRATWWNRGKDLQKFRSAQGKPLDLFFAVALSSYGELHVELRIEDAIILTEEAG